ncbi:MAG TPA: hypothetical protein VK753_10710 [Xanthomonadaceae bacterium]|jgi:hypothetical protein|nr:hypothetical protein [Xanthomonadaceae bacterium]
MTNRQRLNAFALLASVALVACGTASAQDHYAGTWTIASSEPAPWPHKADEEDPKEIKRLVGTTVVFKADRIAGPVPVACKGPHYKIEQYGADMLFQGSLEENGDPKTTPDKAATALGFARRPIPSITTGCASELEFHVIDDDHMLFGLNNRVYRMTRAKTASGKSDKP